jgi:hypothetical protein
MQDIAIGIIMQCKNPNSKSLLISLFKTLIYHPFLFFNPSCFFVICYRFTHVDAYSDWLLDVLESVDATHAGESS